MRPELIPAGEVILCINSGSSSLKFALYLLENGSEKRIVSGAVERIGLPNGRLSMKGESDQTLADLQKDFPGHSAAAAGISAAIRSLGLPPPAAAGHRVVHGGLKHRSSERVDSELLLELRKLVRFAPLHLPNAIAAIEAVAARFPRLPQVACFDTAFHRSMPNVAQRFPLADSFWEIGFRRYGFHGLSFEYVLDTLGEASEGRVIIAHLGNGASLAALRDGQPLDTTMGFTPTGGLMMGTRSGDLDPGLLIHLMSEKGYDSHQLDNLVNQQAGLLGVSGISPDMKTLLERREREPHAAEAVELFCYQLRKHIGAMSAVLGGLDTLVFTGGIGEHAAPVRWDVCRDLNYLGVILDPKRNDADDVIISADGSPCTVRVIPTNEDLMIARHTHALLFPTVTPLRRS